MAAIDIIPAAYGTLVVARRQKGAEALARARRELSTQEDEFDALVARAFDEGAGVTEVANRMGVSRQTVYNIRRRVQLSAPTAAPLVADPETEYIVRRSDGFWDVTAPIGGTFRVNTDGPVYEYDESNAPVAASVPTDEWFAWWAGVHESVLAYIAGQNQDRAA